MITPDVLLHRLMTDPWLARVSWVLAASWLFFLLHALWRIVRAPVGTRLAELNGISWVAVGVLLLALFISYALVAALLYAVLPEIALLAAPLACTGHTEIVRDGWVLTDFLCQPATGEKQNITGRMVEVSGAYNAILIATVPMWRSRVGWPRRAAEAKGVSNEEAAPDSGDDVEA